MSHHSALTAEQSRHYQEHGYLVIKALVSDEECDTFLNNPGSPLPEGHCQPSLVRHRSDAVWGGLCCQERIVAVLTELMGAAPKIVQSMFIPKQGATEGQHPKDGVALHQDCAYIRTDKPTLMAAWVALSDTDPENGGLCLVPGSHLRFRGDLNPEGRDHQGQTFTNHHIQLEMCDPDGREWVDTVWTPKFPELGDHEILRLTVPKGGVVFFDGYLVHGSYANFSPRKRLAFATHYVREDTWVYRTDLQLTMPARLGAICPA